MPTNNPKVSAYIPQHIFDRFKQFYEERDISMSQAVAVIFAEHFQLDLQVNFNSSSPITEAALTRLDTLEKEVQDLKFNSELPGSILSDLQNLQYLVNQIEHRLHEVETKQISELNSSLQSELPEASQEDDSVKQLSILETVESFSEGDRNQINLEEVEPTENLDISEPTEGLLSEPGLDTVFNVDRLAKRLGVTAGYIAVYKSKHKGNKQKFLDWIQSKDPDRIQWIEVVSKKRGTFYKPTDNTPSELLSKLQKWIKRNL